MADGEPAGRSLWRARAAVAACLLLVAGACQWRTPLESRVTATTSGQLQFLFTNAYVAVVEYRLEPGQRLAVPPAHAAVLVPRGAGSLEVGDRPLELLGSDVGRPFALDLRRPEIANIGLDPVSFVLFTRRGEELPPKPLVLLRRDPELDLPADHTTPLYESPDLRIVEVDLGPHEQTGAHTSEHRLMLPLDSFRLRIESDRVRPLDIELSPGRALWRDPDVHWLENLSDHPARLLVFELKR